jgi:monofunctional biosynthetic peptidoglycan transglycosylase
MARKSRKTRKKEIRLRDRPWLFVRRVLKYIFRGVLVMIALAVLVTVAFTAVNPPTTPYMFSEGRRIGGLNQTWIAIEDIAPVMARSAVAAEDAGFCLHWGLDLTAIRSALEDGGNRGGSTISQQVVKNVYLWQGRSWLRKSLEAVMTPMVEAIWTKQRILEVYLNIAEFDEGVFGVEAASVHYFDVNARDLSPVQAARLAAILPSPKTRSASQPSSYIRTRAASISDGAATIRADGRSACFE